MGASSICFHLTNFCTAQDGIAPLFVKSNDLVPGEFLWLWQVEWCRRTLCGREDNDSSSPEKIANRQTDHNQQSLRAEVAESSIHPLRQR